MNCVISNGAGILVYIRVCGKKHAKQRRTEKRFKYIFIFHPKS